MPHEFRASAVNNSKDYQLILKDEKEAEEWSIVKRRRLYKAGTLLLAMFKLFLLTCCFPTGLVFEVVQRD